MLLHLLEYQRAEHLDDALRLLSRTDIKTAPLAGGTYLLGLRDDSIQAVLDLRELELAYITADEQGIHIGSMTTLQSMVDSALLKDLASGLLAHAALASSFSRLIRNCATLGGTLGADVASQADLLTALAALDAEVALRSDEAERRIPYSSLAVERQPKELIIEVLVPHPGPGSAAAFMRVGRTPTDVALINAAAFVQVTAGVYQHVRLALGGVNMQPMRLQAVERELEGQPAMHPVDPQRLLAAVQAGMTNFQPPSDFRASSDYRRVSGTKLAFRVLEEATNRSHWYDNSFPEEGAN